MQTLWHLSRLKQRICFAFMPVISNALKSKCRFQSADSEYKMLLVVRNKFLIHIEYAEDKYKKLPGFQSY